MSENKKIAKNSLLLYIKLIITTCIGFYASRLVLLELGADDFGLYAVVGGVVSILGFISSTLSTTTYRFILIEMGKGRTERINSVFNSSFLIFLIAGIIVVIFGETFGVWYVKNHLNVDPNKIDDALFVLNMVIISSFFSMIRIPYEGIITAHENFITKVIVEITKSSSRLALLLLLMTYDGNKLRAYAVIMLIVMALPTLIYYTYCMLKYYEQVKFKINKDVEVYREMLGFSGWMAFGAFSRVTEKQGGAIIINLFFGTVINASFGIANQVYGYLIIFVNNISLAAVPQIMKSQGANDNRRSVYLVYAINKYSYFILFIISIPVIFSISPILKFWLKEVPQFTSQFAVLMLINGLINVSGTALGGAIQATGKIKLNQLLSSTFILLTLPIAYFLFYLGYPPYFITVGIVFISIIIRVVRSFILSSLLKEFDVMDDFKKVIWPALLLSLIVIPLYYLRAYFNDTFLDIFFFSSISVVLTLICIFYLGLVSHERFILKKLALKFKKSIFNQS